MKPFENIYQQVIRKKTLKDEITVEELPKGIKKDIELTARHLDTLKSLKVRDDQRAKEVLQKLKDSLKRGS